MRTLFSIVVICLILLPAGPAQGAEDGQGRFFLMGDGKIHIKNAWNGKEVRADLLTVDGSLNEGGFAMIDEVFSFPTRGKGEHISPRLIFMLDYFSDLAAPGKAIMLQSGYRSPEYNAGIRSAGANAARTSQHLDGMAIDFYIEGVDGKELWELIRSRDCCGVGHYGGASVHLDSARPRFWEAATSKTKTKASAYNRAIYLSTDYDRYRPGDPVRLSFSSVSNFGFGIKPAAALVTTREKIETVAAEAEARLLQDSGNPRCLRIEDRKTSRFIYLDLPADLSPGRYRIKIDFCDRPFPKMPAATISNEIEVFAPRP
ncbi:MAG: DUF882 domain-containing protein [Syntrophaceae bacterium]|nr:DUF882 domain-containing protein [Syntrophaceae bacterium]